MRRIGNSISFNHSWIEYSLGFGDIDGSYWYGLDQLHRMTASRGNVTLRIDFEDCDGSTTYQEYTQFSVCFRWGI